MKTLHHIIRTLGGSLALGFILLGVGSQVAHAAITTTAWQLTSFNTSGGTSPYLFLNITADSIAGTASIGFTTAGTPDPTATIDGLGFQFGGAANLTAANFLSAPDSWLTGLPTGFIDSTVAVPLPAAAFFVGPALAFLGLGLNKKRGGWN